MDITIVSTSSDIIHSLDPTRYFGLMLTKSLSIIRMLHWYAVDFNTHEILGDLYTDLNNLFDKLQEEIIGTSKISQVMFPSFSPDTFNDIEVDQYQCDCDGLTDVYNLTTTKIIAILESNEFSNYIQSVSSGLNNTKEDIISRINKSNYLLSMVKP